MAGLLRLKNYKEIYVSPVNENGESALVEVKNSTPVYMTAMIFVDGEVVDYKTSEEQIAVGTMEINIPTMYRGKPFSVFVFSAKDGYTNRDIGRSYWSVWFDHIKVSSFAYYGSYSSPKGSLLVNVPVKGSGFGISFTRLGDSSSAHGVMVMQ